MEWVTDFLVAHSIYSQHFDSDEEYFMVDGLMISMPIEKKIVMNEMQQPVAVQINYQDWLKIEQQLSLESVPTRKKPLCSLHTFRASLTKQSVSSVDLIRQLRDEGY